MHGHCHVWPWFSELSGVVLCRFTLSRSTIFTDYHSTKPKTRFYGGATPYVAPTGCAPLISENFKKNEVRACYAEVFGGSSYFWVDAYQKFQIYCLTFKERQAVSNFVKRACDFPNSIGQGVHVNNLESCEKLSLFKCAVKQIWNLKKKKVIK